jgi:hypothetical protein
VARFVWRAEAASRDERIFRRRMPGRADAANGDRSNNDGIRDRAAGKSGYRARDLSGTSILRNVLRKPGPPPPVSGHTEGKPNAGIAEFSVTETHVSRGFSWNV